MPKTTKIYKTRPGQRAYRVRTKQEGQFLAHLIPAKSSRKAASRRKGRVLSSSKISMEELLKIGDFFKLGDQLMKEFKEDRRCKDEKIDRVESGMIVETQGELDKI